MPKENFKISEHNKIGDGMTVPPNYFSTFKASMQQKLNDFTLPEEKSEKPRTVWQRYRPYIYLAAMFAGVWCMTKMFSLMQQNSPLTIDNSEVLTVALNNNDFFDDYILTDINEYDLLDELYADGISFAYFKN